MVMILIIHIHIIITFEKFGRVHTKTRVEEYSKIPAFVVVIGVVVFVLLFVIQIRRVESDKRPMFIGYSPCVTEAGQSYSNCSVDKN